MILELIMNRIHPNTTFSYNLIKGSQKTRNKFVAELNEKFFVAFDKLIQSKNATLKDVKKIYDDLLPEKKDIETRRNKDSYFAAAMDYKYDSKNNIVGLTIELPLKESKIEASQLPTIMHENTHILTTLANPKHTALTQKLYLQGKFSELYDNWYHNTFYTEEEFNEDYQIDDMITKIVKSTKKFLKGKPCKDKVYLLQDARYQLEQELTAYNEQLKYAHRLKAMGREVDEEHLENFDDFFLFTPKINILKIMISEYIAKARKKIAEKNKRKERNSSFIQK